MLKHALSLFLLLVVFGVSAPAHAKLNVAATTPDLAAIAAEVGGDHVEVKAMATPNQDAHYVDPKPSLTLVLNKADVLIVNGLELEVGWLPPLQRNARNSKILSGGDGYFDASAHVDRIGQTTKIDRSQGDIHPGGNPHFMHDPRAGRAVAKALGEHFANLDSANADAYRANAKKLVSTLDKLIASERDRFKALPSRKVVSYHDSLVYLYDWLDIDQVLTVEPKPGIAPNPGHVARVLKTMRAQNINAIVQEAYYPRKTSQTLTRMAKATLVVIPGGTSFQEGESYEARVKRATEEIYNALTKK